MEIELKCPRCACRLAAAPEMPFEEVMARMATEGPWVALANGATFEDMIFAVLLRRGSIRCPECQDSLQVSEASLARLTERFGAFQREPSPEYPLVKPTWKPR